MNALPPWSLRLLSELDDADRRAQQLARDLNHDQLNWSPAPGAWSVGQCLQHLVAGNEVYLPAIAHSLEGPRREVQEITLSRLSRWFIRNYIAPDSTTRAKAPKKIRPVENIDVSVLDAFLRTNQAARELIRKASAYDVNRIRFSNPFVPLLRFTVGTGLEVTCKHEARHLQQAERVRQSSAFPSRT